ncbi:MAG TPA: hypothetical protein IAB45_05350 [Candidatus Onthousia faecavium]|nr:hypothetical protein [Candidatus Onthousia faecavium]
MEKIKNINIDSTKMVNQFKSTTNNSNYTTMQGNKITKIDSSPVEEMNMEQTSLGSFLASFVIGSEVSKILDDKARQELVSLFNSNGLGDEIYGYNGENIADIARLANGIIVTLKDGMQYTFLEEFGELKISQIRDNKGNSISGFGSLEDLLGNPTDKAGDPLEIRRIYFVGENLYIETEIVTLGDDTRVGGTYVIDPVTDEILSVITDGYLGN